MTIFRETITHSDEKIEVATEENPLAVYPHTCKKCGYEKAQLIECGIEIGDEDCRIKYKCGRCGQVEDVSEKPR
jgi:DNA-directed RNA polymerase subunit M/transcription elongation factor TFIIS